jgi:hypothetical protein
MPPDGLYGSPALPRLITLPRSLLALSPIWFVIVPVFCADLAGRSSGLGGCGTKTPVVYLCSFVFLAGAGYSMYRLVRIGMEGRGR